MAGINQDEFRYVRNLSLTTLVVADLHFKNLEL